jgi:hypothetical protein
MQSLKNVVVTAKSTSAIPEAKNLFLTVAEDLPVSVHAQTVIMQDDSMAPTFVKGDVLTIDHDVSWEPDDFMLVRFGHLFLIRRLDCQRGDLDFMPENPAYPAILEDGSSDPWGVVSAVQHIDGTTQTFDLSTRMKLSEEMSEELEAIAPSAA